VDGLAENIHLGVDFTKLEVISGKFRSHEEADILKIRCVRLKTGIRRGEVVANCAEQIDFIIERERDSEDGLRDRCSRCYGTDGSAISGETIALGRRVDVEFGIKTRASDSSGGSSFGETRGCGYQTLVR